MATLSWLDEYFGPPVVKDEGVELPRRRAIDIVGGTVIATDDPIGERTIISISDTIVGWKTALDVDFTTATNPGLSANGTYTIGGVAGWKRENAANDRVAMTINGGIKIQPAISAYNLSTRSAPLLWLPLSALGITLLDWDTAFRVWIHVTGEGHDVDTTDYVFCGIDSDSLVWCPGWAGSGTNTANARFLMSGYRIDGTEGGSAVTPGGGNWLTYPTGVLRVDIPKLCGPVMAPMTVWSSASAAWPLPNAALLRPMAGFTNFIDSNNDRISSANAGSLGPAAGLGIVIGAYAGSTNDHYTVTITRLRVDYRL